MSWNYRIVHHLDGGWYALHEVHYDEDGLPWGMTDPITFICEQDEGPEGVMHSLKLALSDASKHPVLEEPKVWPGKAP